MTREDIIKLAREVGYPLAEYETGPYVPPLLETLLKHVVAAEREACAKVADDHERQRCEAWAKVLTTGGEVPSASLSVVAAAIRARGQA